MPVPLPNLDTRRFEDLVAEMRTLIPHFSPEWTNHNPSDPGVTLVELLAWMTEATLYRLNRIPDQTYEKFIAQLSEHERQLGETIDEAKRRAVQEFYEPFRVVTEEDFEQAAKKVAHSINQDIERVKIFTNVASGIVTVLIVPPTGKVPNQTLLQVVKEDLNQRKLVGTKLFVRGPAFTKVKVEVTVVPNSNTRKDVVNSEVEKAITDYLDPLHGGPEESGWPFGRSLTTFELSSLVEGRSSVDHVQRVVLNGNKNTTQLKVAELIDTTSSITSQVSTV